MVLKNIPGVPEMVRVQGNVGASIFNGFLLPTGIYHSDLTSAEGYIMVNKDTSFGPLTFYLSATKGHAFTVSDLQALKKLLDSLLLHLEENVKREANKEASVRYDDIVLFEFGKESLRPLNQFGLSVEGKMAALKKQEADFNQALKKNQGGLHVDFATTLTSPNFLQVGRDEDFGGLLLMNGITRNGRKFEGAIFPKGLYAIEPLKGGVSVDILKTVFGSWTFVANTASENFDIEQLKKMVEEAFRQLNLRVQGKPVEAKPIQ